MNKDEIFAYCKDVLKLSNIKMDEPMSAHTSFKIGGKSDIFVTANSVEELKLVLEFAKNNNVPIHIVGNGSNLLVKDNGIRGITLKINFKNLDIKTDNDNQAIVTAGAGIQLGYLAAELCKNNISGFEFAAGIPGSIGGAVRMNAGAYGGEFKDIVVSTKCMDYDGNIITLNNVDHNFSYRKSIFCEKNWIIIESVLSLNVEKDSSEIKNKMNEYAESRREKQPIEYPSAGSTFKRGEDFVTAKLIDECGLKGYSIGGAEVSEKHAGFIINKNQATAEDVLQLVQYVKDCVYKKFNKEIELEVEIIGE